MYFIKIIQVIVNLDKNTTRPLNQEISRYGGNGDYTDRAARRQRFYQYPSLSGRRSSRESSACHFDGGELRRRPLRWWTGSATYSLNAKKERVCADERSSRAWQPHHSFRRCRYRCESLGPALEIWFS